MFRKYRLDVADFQAEARKLGTALLIAGMVGVVFGSFEGHTIPLHVDISAIAVGLFMWFLGLTRTKKEVVK